jgi:hypothetical protein
MGLIGGLKTPYTIYKVFIMKNGLKVGGKWFKSRIYLPSKYRGGLIPTGYVPSFIKYNPENGFSKKCKYCGEWKSRTEFGKSLGYKDGLSHKCLDDQKRDNLSRRKMGYNPHHIIYNHENGFSRQCTNSKCKTWKPKTEFYKSSSKIGISAWCKECTKKYKNERAREDRRQAKQAQIEMIEEERLDKERLKEEIFSERWGWGLYIREVESENSKYDYIDDFNTHHIFPVALFPDYTLEDWNGIPLPIEWHKKFHKKYGRRYNSRYYLRYYGNIIINFILSEIRESNANHVLINHAVAIEGK